MLMLSENVAGRYKMYVKGPVFVCHVDFPQAPQQEMDAKRNLSIWLRRLQSKLTWCYIQMLMWQQHKHRDIYKHNSSKPKMADVAERMRGLSFHRLKENRRTQKQQNLPRDDYPILKSFVPTAALDGVEKIS